MDLREEIARDFGPVIATRSLLVNPSGEIVVELGVPRPMKGFDWICPYRITGLHDTVHVMFGAGVDAFQAILTALLNIGAKLYTSDIARAGNLHLFARDSSGNLMFPVVDGLEDLVPDAGPYFM